MMSRAGMVLLFVLGVLAPHSFGFLHKTSFRSNSLAWEQALRTEERAETPGIEETDEAGDGQSQFLTQLLADRNPDANAEPLIGILAQPLFHSLPNVSFIAASYVQYIEAAGGRAVPIVYTDPKEEIIRRFKEVSGIILPGGTVGLDATSAERYDDVAMMLFEMAVEEHHNGDVIAMHGFCSEHLFCLVLDVPLR